VSAKFGVHHQLNSMKRHVLVNALTKTNVCPRESSNQIFVTVHAQIRKLVIFQSSSTRPPVIVIVGLSSAENHKLKILTPASVNVQSKQHVHTTSFLIKIVFANVLMLMPVGVLLNSISTMTRAYVSAGGLRTVKVIRLLMKTVVNVNVKVSCLVLMVECTILILACVNARTSVVQTLNTKKAHVNVLLIQILVANHYNTKHSVKQRHAQQESAGK